MIIQHRLEDFEEALAAAVGLLTRMTKAGLIEVSRDGILKGLDIIVRSCPELGPWVSCRGLYDRVATTGDAGAGVTPTQKRGPLS